MIQKMLAYKDQFWVPSMDQEEFCLGSSEARADGRGKHMLERGGRNR